MFIPIPEEKKGAWSTRSLAVDDQGSLRQAELVSKYGTLSFGTDDRDGHTGWRFAHSGGAVTLPYAKRNGQFWVGVLPEKRVNLGGTYLCAIGGFKRPSESHKGAAVRETAAEAGATVEPVLLPGLPAVMDRNYSEASPASGTGCIQAYTVLVDGDRLQAVAPDRSASEAAPQFFWVHPDWPNVVFVCWKEAVMKSPDLIVRAAIAQLLIHLEVDF